MSCSLEPCVTRRVQDWWFISLEIHRAPQIVASKELQYILKGPQNHCIKIIITN
jgi:hypothetical protein